MFQNWRIKLREAKAAFEHGQLEEANRLLADGQLEQYLPGRRLKAKVATAVGRVSGSAG